MELDELKVSWNVLNERLKKSEILNKRIIKEMIAKRTRSAHNRLLGLDIYGLIMGIIICVMLFLIHKELSLKVRTYLFLEFILLLSVIWYIIKIVLLNQFNIETKTFYKLTSWTLKYKLILKWERIISPGVGIGSLLLALFMQNDKLTTSFIVFYSIAIVGAIIASYLQYIYVDKKNITIIQQGLEELKELEEE